MADSKLSSLVALTTVAGEDLIYLVDDPSGTPASKKVTLTSLFDLSNDTGLHLVLPQVDDAATPTLGFGDGDTGLYEDIDDRLKFAAGGALRMSISSTVDINSVDLLSDANGSFALQRTGQSSTTPSHSFKNDLDTGVGTPGANQLSLIAGAAEVVNIANDGTSNTATVKGSATQAGSLFVVEDSAGVNEFEVDSTGVGFFAATPVAQQATTGTVTGFTAGSGTAVNDDSTFTGNSGTAAYTIGDIVLALKNYGLLAAS